MYFSINLVLNEELNILSEMGKADKSNDLPGISPQNEASKLLEQALIQMDGIISG